MNATDTATRTPATTSVDREAALRNALATTPRPPRQSAVGSILTFGWRGMLKVKHVPEQLIDVTITPVLFTTVYSGVALNTDMTKGVVDRFRSLPVWRPAPLVGSVVGDSVRYVVAGTVVVVVGLILGFRPDGGVGGVVAAMALVVVFSFGLSWVFTTMGLLMRSPNAVLNTGFMVLFPLTFLSNTFVEPDTLPSALETFVDVNPISFLVSASRGLMAGSADGGDIAVVLGVAALLTAVFAPLTAHLYRTRG